MNIFLDATSISQQSGRDTTTYRGWNLSKVDFRQVSVDVVLNAVNYTIFILDNDENEVLAFPLSAVENQPRWQNTYQGALNAISDISPIIGIPQPGGGGSTVDSIVAGTGIDVDATDPANPIVSQADTAVTPGTYTYATVQVDQQGNVIAASSGVAPGGGDVVGPASSIDSSLPLFDGLSGKLLKQGPELSLGGNVSADDGKVPIFGTEGELISSSDGANPGFTSITSGSGAAIYAVGAGTGEAIVADQNDNTLDAVVVNSGGNEVFAIGPDGELRAGTDPGTTGQVLTSAGAGAIPTWETPTTGDVVGPGSAVDSDIALFDGTTGKLIKSAGINLSEIIEEDPGPGLGLIESGAGVSPIILKNLKNGLGTEVISNTGSLQVDIDFTAPDQFYYSDGSSLPVEGTVTSFARTLLDDATAADARVTLGYVPHSIFKSATTSRVNNTLTVDPDLQVPVAAGEKISGTMTVYITASAAGDFKYRITGPAGFNSLFLAAAWFTSAAGVTSSNLTSQAYDAADRTATSASDFIIRLSVTFEVYNGATPGTFQFEWAQNTTAAGNASSVLVGSQIQYISF